MSKHLPFLNNKLELVFIQSFISIFLGKFDYHVLQRAGAKDDHRQSKTLRCDNVQECG
jgi:hypothetical protein